MSFNAFISYSHSADGRLAPALASSVRRVARPWYAKSTLRLFLDQASLTANPGLWSAIESALMQSEWLIYLASPMAAQSLWVRKELVWWIANKGAHKIIIVLTEGSIRWNGVGNTARIPQGRSVRWRW